MEACDDGNSEPEPALIMLAKSPKIVSVQATSSTWDLVLTKAKDTHGHARCSCSSGVVTMMRTVLALAALAVAALATSSADLNLGAPLKLTLVGQRSVHRGQKLKFKAVLTNNSSAPIILASRDASLDFELSWTINDSTWHELPRKVVQGFACPVGGKRWSDTRVRRLKDSDLTLLQPGDKLEFVSDDISATYILPSQGSYQVTAIYTYVPPRIEGGDGLERDRFGQKYDLRDLSPQTLEMLKHAATVGATSTSTLIIE